MVDYDPNQVPDKHGLSIDSLRGSEHVVRPDLVNGSGTFDGDPRRKATRVPLSYHEENSLRLIGRESELDRVTPAGESPVPNLLPTAIPDGNHEPTVTEFTNDARERQTTPAHDPHPADLPPPFGSEPEGTHRSRSDLAPGASQ